MTAPESAVAAVGRALRTVVEHPEEPGSIAPGLLAAIEATGYVVLPREALAVIEASRQALLPTMESIRVKGRARYIEALDAYIEATR